MGRVVIPGFRKIETSGGGEGGTTNYNDLTNKPSINNVPLVGNLNTVNLKLTDATLTEEGVPAEAKTVGAKLEEHSTSLTAVKEELTKKANISDIPIKVSELQNDSNYQTDTDVTNTLTTYATKTYVGEQISSADHLKREIVTEIPSPETADKNTIYMLKIESATGEDKYKEYLLIDGTVQCIGDTSVDLTDYAKKTEIPTELPANGGNSSTVNGHTVKSDVPENAVFTDTVYDDTEVKESIDELNSNLGASNAGAHNSVYRGKYLGSALTTEQKAQISAGTFNDLYIGDYWTIGGVNYRIASFDYWLNSGDTECTTHHVVIVPDSCLYNAQMNTSNTTTGAYVGSAMYTSNLEQAKTIINNAFGSANILSHRELLANATTGNRATAWSWYDSTVELMNESMVYGSPVGGKAVDDSINYNVGIDKSQLPLFALEHSRITNRADWWLRDVVAATYFAYVGTGGGAGDDGTFFYYGVRPAFGIKG